MHHFALKNIEDAKQYYHISAKASNIPDINNIPDEALPSLMDIPDARQYLHITYGLILNADNGQEFRGEIFRTLSTHETPYDDAIIGHIGRHLDTLKVPKK
jgi:hypothetical protein